jgi:elongation factor P
MANTSDFRNGLIFNHKNGLWKIVEFLHVKPGKGAAFVRTKLKNIETGRVVDHTFNAGTKIDPVRIETREYQYLYNDDMGFHFLLGQFLCLH